MFTTRLLFALLCRSMSIQLKTKTVLARQMRVLLLSQGMNRRTALGRAANPPAALPVRDYRTIPRYFQMLEGLRARCGAHRPTAELPRGPRLGRGAPGERGQSNPVEVNT
jgi:hypothetical protein